MNFWAIILLIGLVSIVSGLSKFFKNWKTFRKKKRVFLIGIILPVFIAYSYSEILLYNNTQGLTLIDIGGLMVLGTLSGIFIACYLLMDRI